MDGKRFGEEEATTDRGVRKRVKHRERQSLPRVVGPYTLSNLCQRLKSSLPLY
jgi:hypothetical protein